MKELLALGLAVACGAAHGQCSDDIESALRAFHVRPALEGDVIAADCKSWPPAAGHVTAAVMAFAPADTEDGFRNVLGVLALVDTRTHKVLQGRRFWVGEDAATRVGARSLVLDTANYALAPGVRALGLRFRNASSGPGVAERRLYDELMLFAPSAGQLDPVLGQTMKQTRAIEGCLGRCRNAVWEEASLTLAVSAAGPSGWNDLIITARLVQDGTSEPPTWNSTPRLERLVYRFKNGHYGRLIAGDSWWTESYCCALNFDTPP